MTKFRMSTAVAALATVMAIGIAATAPVSAHPHLVTHRVGHGLVSNPNCG